MAENEEQIERRIAEDRERVAETAGAIGYKADVPSRAREKVGGAASQVKDKIMGGADAANERTPDSEEAKAKARRAAGMAQENPLGLALASVAVGFVVGSLIPGTRVEDERIGPVADDAKQHAMEMGQDALERGQESAKEIGQEAADKAKEHAQAHGQEMSEDAKGRADDVQGSAQDEARRQGG